ncbi:MAG: 6-bladed beta-propeller [Algoriphagus sp.]|nr:6-bladed beta-propeller [Algoriphagus sp.]
MTFQWPHNFIILKFQKGQIYTSLPFWNFKLFLLNITIITMMNKPLIFFATIITIIGCRPIDDKNGLITLTPIPIPEEKTIKLSNFIKDIEYSILPAEAKVARIDEAQKFENFYFLADYEITRGISIIDQDFELVSNIHNYGEGPGEYLTFLDFTINKNQKTIDLLTLNKLIRYDFNGNFLDELKLPGIISQIQHIEGDTYLLYKSKGLHENFKGPDDISILWTWNLHSNELKRVPSSLERVNIPLFTERNNLISQGNKLQFSTNFLDTIYIYSNKIELVEKRFFNSNRPNFPYSELKNSSQLEEKLNDPEIQKTYYYQLTNLLENETHFVTAMIFDGKYTNLIYNKQNKKSILFSEIKNDLDGGHNWVMPVLLDDENLISIMEASYLVDHFEKGRIPENSPFFQMAKNLTPNSPLVMIKYHLK